MRKEIAAERALVGKAEGDGAAASLANKVMAELGVRDVMSGRWFPRVVATYLRHRAQRRPRADGRASPEALIMRASAEAALAGATAGTATTGATLLGGEGSLGALAAVPLAGVAIVVETIARTLLDLRLACDLADRAGVPFDPQDPGDLSRLCALATGTAQRRGDRKSLGRTLVERLTEADEPDRGRTEGSRRLGEGVVKNAVPGLNVLTSAAASWLRTRSLGQAAWRYVQYRRAVSEAFEAAAERWGPAADLLVEGAWVLFTADGPLQPDEASLLVHLLRRAEPSRRTDLMARFMVSNREFFERLKTAPAASRPALWHALQLLAAADGTISKADSRILEGASEALGYWPERRAARQGRVVAQSAVAARRLGGSRTAAKPPGRAAGGRRRTSGARRRRPAAKR